MCPSPQVGMETEFKCKHQFSVIELAVEELQTYSAQFDAKIWTSFKMEEKNVKLWEKKQKGSQVKCARRFVKSYQKELKKVYLK